MIAEAVPEPRLPVGEVVCGDCLDVLKGLPDCCVSCCVTDPPYGIAFMAWDWDREIPGRAIWAELLRVLKPGASAFICAGARQDTLLGMLLDLREVGFEIEHSALTWVFANGAMPKSVNLSSDADRAAFNAWAKDLCKTNELTLKPSCVWEDRHKDQREVGAECAECKRRLWALAEGHENIVTQADLRKAASAAVNGEAQTFGNATGAAPNGNTYCHERNGGSLGHSPIRSTGTRLLSALVSRFGEAPGVRAKVGDLSNGWPSWQDYRHADDGWGDSTQPRNVTAPATPEAVALEGLHGGAVPLKPMSEAILWVTKPMDLAPIRANVQAHGVGAVDVDGCRVPYKDAADYEFGVRDQDGMQYSGSKVFGGAFGAKGTQVAAGRYPSNLLVTARSLGDFSRFCDIDKWAAERGLDAEWLDAALEGIVRVPKPSRAEKNAGCEGMDEKGSSERVCPIGNSVRSVIDRKDGRGQVPVNARCQPRPNNHPTVKPVTLMAYLIALACPIDGVVLDPFCGSGTTCVAAAELGRQFIGIELDAGYCEIARARVAAAKRPEPTLFSEAAR